MTPPEPLQFHFAGPTEGSALLVRPKNARWLLALAHGAGAGMTHPFLENLTNELSAAAIATFRYQFPYMEQRRRVPDSPAILTATVAAAVQTAKTAAPNLPLLAGGKTQGGKNALEGCREKSPAGVWGSDFFGFPAPPAEPPGNQTR